jgi:hypothetical protein
MVLNFNPTHKYGSPKVFSCCSPRCLNGNCSFSEACFAWSVSFFLSFFIFQKEVCVCVCVCACVLLRWRILSELTAYDFEFSDVSGQEGLGQL